MATLPDEVRLGVSLPERAVVNASRWATNEADRAINHTGDSLKVMDLLINIDNGGTLTDVCVIDGARIVRTKTITTPHDLSQCFFDGLKKASKAFHEPRTLRTSRGAIR